jgi:hypothetical protein
MIDIGKKILFTFCKMFENVLFFRIRIYICKKCYYDPQKIFFVKNTNICMLSSKSSMSAFKKARKQKYSKFRIVFLAIAFLGAFF